MFKGLFTLNSKQASSVPTRCKVHLSRDESFEAYLEEPEVIDDHPRLPKKRWVLPEGELFFRAKKAGNTFRAKRKGSMFQARFQHAGSDNEFSVGVEFI